MVKLERLLIDWVDQELKAWAAWSNRFDDGKGDYPGQVPYLELRPDGTPMRDHPFERIPEDFAIIDAAIKELLAPLQVVIRVYYKGVSYVRPQNLRKASAFLCLSQQVIIGRLDAAHTELAPKISKQAVADNRNFKPTRTAG